MSLVPVSEITALNIGTGLSSDALQGVIDREEAWLESKIGQLIGERTDTFYLEWARTDDVLLLRRPTDAVTVTDNGTAVDADDIRLVLRGRAVQRVRRTFTGPTVTVTYEPNDELLVERAIIGLVGMQLRQMEASGGAVKSEQIGDYSYELGDPSVIETFRKQTLRALLPTPRAGTLRILSRYEGTRVGVAQP